LKHVSEYYIIFDVVNTYKFLLRWVLVQSGQVPSEENLAVLDSRATILRPHRWIFVVAAVVCREDTGGNVVLQKLLIDRVDNVGYDHADKVLATLQSAEIVWPIVSVDCNYCMQ
jgi:hypothetical protein